MRVFPLFVFVSLPPALLLLLLLLLLLTNNGLLPPLLMLLQIERIVPVAVQFPTSSINWTGERASGRADD